MSGLPRWPARHWRIGLLALSLLAAAALLISGRLIAPALLVVLALLLSDRLRMHEGLRRIAGRIDRRQPLEKLEVTQGTWGELSRAINALMQEQHELRHRAGLQPASLPADALVYLRDVPAYEEGWKRDAAVLVLGLRSPDSADVRRWRMLAQLTDEQSERQQALLLPCATGVQLVFGVFREQPLADSLQQALAAAQAIADAYSRGTQSQLAIGLAGGRVTATTAPGLGFSVIGGAVDQALTLQRLAQSQGAALLCGEHDYLRLYQGSPGADRLPTFAMAQGAAQGVYSVPLAED